VVLHDKEKYRLNTVGLNSAVCVREQLLSASQTWLKKKKSQACLPGAQKERSKAKG